MNLAKAINYYDPKYNRKSEDKPIKDKKSRASNDSLMRAIERAKSRGSDEVSNVKIDDGDIAINSKEMWDSEKGSWVPFDLWGAHFIVNERREYLAVRIYRPSDIQPENGPIVKGWHSMDTSYMNEQLKEDRSCLEKYTEHLHKSFVGYKEFREMVRQDRIEEKNPF